MTETSLTQESGQEHSNARYGDLITNAAIEERDYIRELALSDQLKLICSNLGGYEAVLHILINRQNGVSVYDAVASAKSGFASQSGIIARLRIFREAGLIEQEVGRKKSQVLLFPAERLVNKLGTVLIKRSWNKVNESHFNHRAEHYGD